MPPGFTVVTESEFETFKNTLSRYRHDKNDFELLEIPQFNVKGKPENIPLRGKVIVRRISNGREATYRAGSGLPWPTYFQEDLEQGSFGSL